MNTTRTEIRKYHIVNPDLEDYIREARFVRSVRGGILAIAAIRPDLLGYCKGIGLKRVTEQKIDRMLDDLDGYILNAFSGQNGSTRRMTKLKTAARNHGFMKAVLMTLDCNIVTARERYDYENGE